jgi:prevent-host-death family protein
MNTTVSKARLKARMLEYLREVERTGDPLIVTDRGRPVLKIVPIRAYESADVVFADVRGRVALPSDAELNAPLPDDVFADSDLADLL